MVFDQPFLLGLMRFCGHPSLVGRCMASAQVLKRHPSGTYRLDPGRRGGMRQRLNFLRKTSVGHKTQIKKPRSFLLIIFRHRKIAMAAPESDGPGRLISHFRNRFGGCSSALMNGSILTDLAEIASNNCQDGPNFGRRISPTCGIAANPLPLSSSSSNPRQRFFIT